MAEGARAASRLSYEEHSTETGVCCCGHVLWLCMIGHSEGATLRLLTTCRPRVSPWHPPPPRRCGRDRCAVARNQALATRPEQLAPNPSLRFPAHAYIPGFGPDIRNHRETGDSGPDSHDLEMPEGAETIAMKPGSALFVPRGWWHRTAAVTDSVSIRSSRARPPLAILSGPWSTGQSWPGRSGANRSLSAPLTRPRSASVCPGF